VTIEGIGELSIREEPAVEQAATLVLTSEESDLEGYEKVILLRRWAIAHDYQPGKLVRFFHHLGPLQTYTRDEWIIEAQLPLEPGS
jgi:hypothetical protein